MDTLISIAPLMGYTDPYFCRLMRWIAPDIHLYTEMLHAGAVIHGQKHHHYGDLAPHISLQLGGSNPDECGKAARLASEFGFAALNLNLGCPSPKVQKGSFGACLMKNKALVSECLSAMQDQSTIPVSIKCRLGVDDYDSDAFFFDFMSTMLEVGCDAWVVHARIAILNGLSTKENREIPVLNYDRVWRLKMLFPQASICINGGIQSIEAIDAQLTHVDGVMLGRWAMHNTWDMRGLQMHYFPDTDNLLTKDEVINHYIRHVETRLDDDGFALSYKLRHLANLYHGEPHAKQWRSQVAQCKDLHLLMRS